jgi:hypothetical protein
MKQNISRQSIFWGFFLSKIKEIAENHFKLKIKEVVMTVSNHLSK